MKSIIKYLPILILVACGKPGSSDVKKQIADKKAQIAKIEQEISVLQKKLNKTADSTKFDPDKKLVGVEPVKFQSFSHYIEVQGALDGDENVAVYPEGMGVVEEIFVTVGQHVTKGQELARLNDGAVQEQLKGLQGSLDLATTVYEKTKSLWDQKIGSEVQYLQAKNAKESLEANVAALKRQLQMMHITSPINGTVEDAPIKIGQTASPQFPAFRVINFSKLKVVSDVAEAYAAKIKIGDKILVNLPDIKQDYIAEVTFASNYINQVNRTFRVEAHLKESNVNMKANMVAILKINDYKNDQAIVLPVNYVQKDQKGTFVFVSKKDGNGLKATKRFVTTGQIYNGMAEIASGLNSGDEVITLGYLDVEEGENIKL
jgi:membrane fusion protein, multidrug efflux system